MFADEVSVVADFSRGRPEDLEELGRTVRSTDDDGVIDWVLIHGVDSSAEGAGRDGREVVDEPLRFEFAEFCSHVAADGDHMISCGVERGFEHPVVVGAHLEQLLTVRRIDGADGVVGAAEGDF